VYCPRCATENLDDAKFCRACGLDIHLVPQALTGLLPDAAATDAVEKQGKKEKKEKDGRLLEKGLENVFVGVAFLVIFLAGLFYFRGAFMIWIWFIIPSLACVGEGLGQLIRWRREQRHLAELFRAHGAADPYPLPSARAAELPAPDTAEMADSPFSVTEATTRHLKARAEAPRRDL
jgi:zinc-ribbon domain